MHGQFRSQLQLLTSKIKKKNNLPFVAVNSNLFTSPVLLSMINTAAVFFKSTRVIAESIPVISWRAHTSRRAAHFTCSAVHVYQIVVLTGCWTEWSTLCVDHVIWALLWTSSFCSPFKVRTEGQVGTSSRDHLQVVTD